jgi:predicted lipid-binding transport protein (Tim44 family)
MTLSQRTRSLFKVLAVAVAVAMPVALVVSTADARIGGGGSMGSRGSRTFSAPPATRTAPNVAQPMQRTITQPGVNSSVGQAANTGGFFRRPGLLGGLAAGFLGAGLLGLLFGGSLFGGLGGLSSIIGLILQVVLIVIVARLVMSWWQRRNNGAAMATPSGPSPSAQHFDAPPQQGGFGGFGGGFGGQPRVTPLNITPDDYDAFERLLGESQKAWSDEDMAKLQAISTPEMASYFAQDLAANRERGVVNRVSDVKLLQGDLSEAWRENNTDYATVAMRFSLVDKLVDRASGRIVEGSDTPTEATEVITFARRPGEGWELSAIQQVA